MLKDHTILCSTGFILIHIEAGMPPSANVRDELLDLALGPKELGPPLGQSQFYYLYGSQCCAAYCRAAIEASNKALV
jgi:hypothetical protein